MPTAGGWQFTRGRAIYTTHLVTEAPVLTAALGAKHDCYPSLRVQTLRNHTLPPVTGLIALDQTSS